MVVSNGEKFDSQKQQFSFKNGVDLEVRKWFITDETNKIVSINSIRKNKKEWEYNTNIPQDFKTLEEAKDVLFLLRFLNYVAGMNHAFELNTKEEDNVIFVIKDDKGRYVDKNSLFVRNKKLQYAPSLNLTNGCCYFKNEDIANQHLEYLNELNKLHNGGYIFRIEKELININ